MLGATEAQLKSITAKAAQLEALMTGKIEAVRSLKRARDGCEEEVEALRAKLAEAEQRLRTVQTDLEQKTSSLKLVADEYNKAQLLQKRYKNTLSEKNGSPRVIVKIKDPLVSHGTPQRSGARHDWGAVCVADPCTVNVPAKSKSFVFDSVITPSDPQNATHLFAQLNGEGMAHDVLSGYNVTLFTFGQSGAGKTQNLFGASAADGGGAGVVDLFISQLFTSMEDDNVECFTVKAQMMELNNDTLYDLFSDPSAPQSHMDHAAPYEVLRDDKGRVHVPGMQQVGVAKAAQLSQLFHWGLNTRDKRPHAARRVGKSHYIFTCTVENYNRKGDFRRAKLTFIDLAAPTPAPENAWVAKSHQAIGDVISILSTAAHQRGGDRSQNVAYRNNKLTMLMSDALGGNCKTVMLCCVTPSPAQMEELLTSLIYAYHLKCIVNTPSPYDIPADLQKLEEQIRSIDFGED